MNKLPEALLASLEDVEGFNRESFVKVHESGERVTSVRVNPAKMTMVYGPSSMVPWTSLGYYLPERPSFTFDPLFHAGCYYVQEASSMFLEQALKQTVDLSQSLKILDVAAAPGGKSTHIQSLITKDSLLVSNEVIKSRANILKDNIIKWGCENVVVTNNDPRDFAALENYFDVIVLDAPCSGSGLFRRDDEAIDEWSINNVQLCSQRQQRILVDCWPALKQEGVIIYSTCSYSKEENEEILDWMMKEFQVANCKLQIDASWSITETQSSSGAYGYRFWPDKIKGEGFFIACFKKMDGGDECRLRSKKKLEKAGKKEIEYIRPWLQQNDHQLAKVNQQVYAFPIHLFDDIELLSGYLRLFYSGVQVGELIREKLIPEHSLAMSHLLAGSIERTELGRDDAIQYLKKKELNLDKINKGWQLVTYKHHPLGWINVLPNRINNYYPKELRILKDI